MDCSRVKKELVAYLDGELKRGAAEQVQAHLRRCPACKLEAEQLSAAGALLDSLPDIEPAGDFTARAMRKALRAPPEPALRPQRLLRRLIPAAAAAVVLVALTLYLTAPGGPPTIADLSPAEQEIVKNMEVLENLELLEDLEILKEMDLLQEYDEEDFESS